MLVAQKRLRLSGHGTRIRLHKRGNWKGDEIDGLRMCWGATIAVEKALGEAVRQGRDAGLSWEQIGRALGVVETATSGTEVLEAVITARREMSQRFWATAT